MPHGSTRLGLLLFAVYLVLYGGFVLLAAFSPQAMEATPLAGVNLAIWYGFGLIVAAIVLALIYGWAHSSGPQASIDSAEKPETSRDARVVDAGHRRVPGVRRRDAGPQLSTWARRPSRRPATSPPTGRFPGSSTAWRSPATICRPRRSSASAG